MGVRDAFGRGPLGLSDMGLAVLERSGSLRALWHRAGQAAQKDNRVGLPALALGEALAPGARDRGRRRRRICVPEAPRPVSEALQPGHLHHPLALGRRPLRASLATVPRSNRTTSHQGRATSEPLCVAAEDPDAEWEPITITGWYGVQQRTVEVVSATALWYSTGLPAVPLRWVLIRDPQEEFDTHALLCTDLHATPERIISWFVRRWQMEATFQEVRQRLGFETQRHWSQKAIRRTAPAMLGLFWLVTLLAHRRMQQGVAGTVRQAAWYEKVRPTFSDALAVVRKELWTQQQETFYGSLGDTDTVKVPRAFMERLTDTVCYAA